MALTLMKLPVTSGSFTRLHHGPCSSSKPGLCWSYSQCDTRLAGFLAQGPVHLELRRKTKMKQGPESFGRTKTSTKIYAKPDQEGSSDASSQPGSSLILEILSQPRIWLQGVIVITTLGFIDAGYSGDWSRFGFISPELEELLRQLAFIVCPTAAFAVWYLGQQKASS